MEHIDEITPRERIAQKDTEKKDIKEPIGYTGLILDDRSKERLNKAVDDLVPDGWDYEETPHVTLKMGGIKDEDAELVRLQGWALPIFATHVGMNDKALAVGVEIKDIDTKNKMPHITVAYDGASGARPKDSNTITEWKPLRRKIMLRGHLKEMPAFNREGFN